MRDELSTGTAMPALDPRRNVPSPTLSDDHHGFETLGGGVIGGGGTTPAAPLTAKRKRKAAGADANCVVKTSRRLHPASLRGDHWELDAHSQAVASPSSSDQPRFEPHCGFVAASPLVHGGQTIRDTLAARAAVDELVELWKRRRAWHSAEKILTQQAKAICRRFVGGDKKQADILFAAVAKEAVPDGHFDAVAAAIFPLLQARAQIEPNRKAIEKRLIKLAESLPVWDAWAKDIRGFGALSLASVIGETGNLSNYAKPSKVWKRMGLAVMPDGTRQRRVPGVDALVHGYVPERRSVAWNVGECIIKVGGPDSPYRQLYDARKLVEADRVESKLHAHRRASRYMTKRVLRHLWVAWRRASQSLDTTSAVPADNSD